MIHIIISHYSGKTEVCHFSSPFHWKSELRQYLKDSKVFWSPLSHEGENLEKLSESIEIFLTQHEAKDKNSSVVVNEEWEGHDDFCYVYAVDPGNPNALMRISIETFMNWMVESVSTSDLAPAPATGSTHGLSGQLLTRGTMEGFVELEKSFKHGLSDGGQDALDVVKVELFERYCQWNVPKPTIVAPVASLSQGSGSGKSKLAVELIQDGPGFYVVTRPADSFDMTVTGYPRNNSLSKVLKDLALNSDNIFKSFLNEIFHSCQSGRILLFFSKIITVCIRDLLSRITSGLENNQGNVDRMDLVRAACYATGKLFEKNESIDCRAILNDIALDQFIINTILSGPENSDPNKTCFNYIVDPSGQNKSFVPTVNGIASYIKLILDDPLSAALEKNSRDASNLLSQCLNLFPFIFVIDEADELSAQTESFRQDNYQKVTIPGFEVVRRALSYLIPQTKIFFLTLGTRSDIIDLNPPLRENSARLVNRQSMPKPILLLSNTSTFTKYDFPIESLNISYDALLNPIQFKHLATLGHPLWSSRPFNEIVDLAKIKLLNGSQSSFEYVLCIWMIRAGLAANPLDIQTRSLIASHMATLFDLDEQLIRMIVFYPSDPILALACRQLITELPKNQELLFSMLDKFFELAQIDRGRVAECVGMMIVLRAIDIADKCFVTDPHSRTAEDQIREMVKSNPALEELWRKKFSVLEPKRDTNNPNIQPISTFDHYHVVTVESFLKNLLSEARFNCIKQELPVETLEGLVNASHAIKLTRTGKDGFTFNNKFYPAMKIPVADERIADQYCNIIDDALIRLGLVHQCCFFMPERYYGYDIIIPVMLKSGAFTYIGIQFKAADVSISAPTEKMQSRFHHVRCPLALNGGHSASTCPNCSTQEQTFASRFANQISLLISLDPSDSKTFAEGLKSSIPSTSIHSAYKNFKKAKEAEMMKAIDEIQRHTPSMPRAAFDAFVQNQQVLLMNACKDHLAQLESKTVERSAAIERLSRALSEVNMPAAAIKSQLSSITLRGTSFMKPLMSKRQPFGPNKCTMLMSSIWFDALMSPNPEEEKVTRDKRIVFFQDPFVHRQYTIATRGLEVFRHLFAHAQSISNAQKLLTNEVNFFRQFNDGSASMRDFHLLKSMLFDANLNYPEFNYILAHWRGLGNIRQDGRDALGYRLLTQNSESFLKMCISDSSRGNFFNPTDWLIGNNMPSKRPNRFRRIASGMNRRVVCLRFFEEVSEGEESQREDESEEMIVGKRKGISFLERIKKKPRAE